MSTVEEIERAIKQLSPGEITRLARLVVERENENWDEQMEQDAAAGRLELLVQQAETARAKGTLRDWPAKGS